MLCDDPDYHVRGHGLPGERPPRPGRSHARPGHLGIERSSKSHVELGRLFWDPDQDVPFKAVVSPVPGDYAPEMLKGNWVKMSDALTKAGYGIDRRYAVRVTVREQGVTTAAWEDRAAIDPDPLVRATRELVPDKTFRSRLDVDAVFSFRIPARRLRAGRAYDVTLDFLDPHGKPHPFPSGSTPETGSTFSVRHEPLDLSKILIKGRMIHSTDGLLGRARKSPIRASYASPRMTRMTAKPEVFGASSRIKVASTSATATGARIAALSTPGASPPRRTTRH